VEVKTRASKGDRAKMTATAIQFQVNAETGATSVSADYEATVFAALEVAIVRWSFDEPPTPEAIRLLEEEDYDLITSRINELWKPREPEEAKNSSGDGARLSLMADPSPKNSAATSS